jgi:hypothetical protein
MKRLVFLQFFFFVVLTSGAQLTQKDYQRADSVSEFQRMILHDVLDLQWIENTHILWYKIPTRVVSI